MTNRRTKEDPIALTICDALWRDRPETVVAVQRVQVLAPWEADLIVAIDSGAAFEYEIKSTRGDLLSDIPGVKRKISKAKMARHRRLSTVHHSKEKPTEWVPNFFYFATVPGIAGASDIPDYAGWIEVDGLKVIRKKEAPLLHMVQLTAAQIMRLAKCLTLKHLDAVAKLSDGVNDVERRAAIDGDYEDEWFVENQLFHRGSIDTAHAYPQPKTVE